MDEILDNPVWQGLNTGNRSLALGNDRVKYFSKEVSPFLGFDELVPERFRLLDEMIPAGQTLAFFSTAEYTVPDPWMLTRRMIVAQMVYHKILAPEFDGSRVRLLGQDDVPQMLALTKLTNPGPFFKNTIHFGDFFGIFEGDSLVALTGERLKPLPYVEVSAVCTHPDHTGKGYAKNLMANQVSRIIRNSLIPILHVLSSNASAIGLYEKLGFRVRKEFFIHVIRKA